LAAIDPATGKQVADVKLDGHPESFQLERKGKRIFVNVTKAGHVAVIDREQGTVIAKWALAGAGSNFPMALDEENHRLFVGCRAPAKLLVLNTDNGKTVAGVDIVGDTDDVFYDAARKRLYVAGGGGHVTVITQADANTYLVDGQAPTAAGARTAFFIPDAGMLYVAVPHRGSQKAELRVFRAEPAK
jgi:DNA-binding beta-propeller fold protein YncE